MLETILSWLTIKTVLIGLITGLIIKRLIRKWKYRLPPGPWALPIVGNILRMYEDCSNMNASSFITFVTYMLRQYGICFYKGLYVIFKLAPDLKKNTVYLSSYIPLNEGHLSILTNSMLRTYTSDVEERIIL